MTSTAELEWKRPWEDEAELIAVFASTWGWSRIDLDATEARQVSRLLDLAFETRSYRMWDAAASFVGGDALKKRTDAITKPGTRSSRTRSQYPVSNSPSLEDIESLAMSLPAPQRADMLKWSVKRRDYLAFCKRRGIEA